MTQNKSTPRSLKIPESLIPFYDVFSFESEEFAELVFEKAIETIYPKRRFTDGEKTDLKIAFKLMRSIKPKSDFEKVLYAQVVVGHLLGMQKLAQHYSKDRSLALKFLNISYETMGRLYGKPLDLHTNITITR